MPLPWTVEGSSYGFGAGGSWLPQPDSWGGLSVEAQAGDPGSTLELYRSALALRRERSGLGAGEDVEWMEAPEGVLSFRRDGFVCTANTTGRAISVPLPGRFLLSNEPVSHGEGVVELPADTTVWWAV